MARTWTSREVLLNDTSVSVGASETNTAVSENFRVGDPRYIAVDVTTSGIQDTTGITVKLQDSAGAVSGSDVWNTKGAQGNVAVTGTASVDTLTCDTKANTVDSEYLVYTDTAGNSWAVYFSSAGVAEVTSITAVADVSGSLDGTYFLLQDTAGSVAFWIDVDNSGTTIPAGASAADRAVEITTIATGDTAATIGGLLRTAIGADSKFTTSGTGSECIVTNVDVEELTDAADGDTGFTFSTTTQGSTYAVPPSGAVYTAIAAGRKTVADISGSTTAAQVAAVVEAAFDGLTGATSVVTTDDTAADGTMTFTAVTAGPSTSVAVYAEDDSAATTPALAFANTTAGVATGTFSFVLMIENSSDQAELPLRPKCRVVVTSGASDAVSIDSVRVSYYA